MRPASLIGASALILCGLAAPSAQGAYLRAETSRTYVMACTVQDEDGFVLPVTGVVTTRFEIGTRPRRNVSRSIVLLDNRKALDRFFFRTRPVVSTTKDVEPLPTSKRRYTRRGPRTTTLSGIIARDEEGRLVLLTDTGFRKKIHPLRVSADMVDKVERALAKRARVIVIGILDYTDPSRTIKIHKVLFHKDT